MNLLLLLEMASSAEPDRVAFRFGDSDLTAAELRDRALGIGAALAESGTAHLAFGSTNSLAFPVAVFAAAAAGIPLIPVNFRLAETRRKEILTRHPGTLVVATEEQLPGLLADGYKAVTAAEFLDLGQGEGTAAPADPDAEAIAVLLYTSGTTSEPKAVVLRHRHLTSYVLGTVEFCSAGPSDTALVAVPPYHVAGVAHVLTNLYGGRRVVYLATFDPDEWLTLVEREGVTHAMVVPTMLARIVDALEESGRAAPRSLESVVYGGSAMPHTVLERALRAFPDVGFVNAYGLTETASTIALLGPEDHREGIDHPDPSVRERLRSAGRAVPGVEIEIRDDSGTAVGPSVVGEIHVRGTAGLRRVPRVGPSPRLRRLVRHPGQRAPRRGGLPVHRRPLRRHDHPGRGEHRARRDRGRGPAPSRRRRVRGGRRRRRRLGPADGRGGRRPSGTQR